MTDWKPVTRQELLDALNKFQARDDRAVDDYRAGYSHGIEQALGFAQERLSDVMALLGMTVRYLTIDRPDVPTVDDQPNAP